MFYDSTPRRQFPAGLCIIRALLRAHVHLGMSPTRTCRTRHSQILRWHACGATAYKRTATCKRLRQWTLSRCPALRQAIGLDRQVDRPSRQVAWPWPITRPIMRHRAPRRTEGQRFDRSRPGRADLLPAGAVGQEAGRVAAGGLVGGSGAGRLPLPAEKISRLAAGYDTSWQCRPTRKIGWRSPAETIGGRPPWRPRLRPAADGGENR